METDQLINAEILCTVHQIDFSFIRAIHEMGLVEIVEIDEAAYIYPEQVGEIEKYIRLRYELEINMEGIEAIHHLLKKIESLTEENRILKNRISES